MKLPEWVRKIPHPGYGNYGGAHKRCNSHKQDYCPMPVDSMDWLFFYHDQALRKAREFDEPTKSNLRKQADEDLAAGLRDERSLKPYHHKIWGPIYRQLAMIPFRI